MILGYKNAKTRKVHETGIPRGFKGLSGELAARRLDAFQAAGSIADLSPLMSVNLHKLSGDRRDQWAMNVNDAWWVCLTLADEGFDEVEIIDYHRG